MERRNYLYPIIAALIVVVVGVYAIDSNSQEASFAGMGDFSGTTDIPEASEQSAPSLQQFNEAIVEIAEQTTPTVVTIRVTQTVQAPQNPFSRFFGNPQGQPEQRQREGLGSGVIVSQDGYILTNNHVVENADEIMVDLSNGESYEGEIIGRDPRTDIAVVKIEAENLEAIEIGNSDNVRVGEMVLAIGSPLGDYLANSVSMGIISAKERTINIIDQGAGYESFLQTDAAINRGNSGGALVNMNGELIGINSAIASQTGGSIGIGFAVPSNLARDVMKSLIEDGEVERAYLGIFGDDINRPLARALGLENSRGIIVNNVEEGTPADEAGLQQGDVIKSLNGNAIESYASFRTAIATSDPGDEITLEIIRDGETREIDVTLGRLNQEATASAQDNNQQNMEQNLGFRIDELTADIARQLELDPGQKGVVVTNVNQGSDAYEQGLRRGAVITHVNKEPIDSVSDFTEQIEAVADQEDAVVLLQVIQQGVNRYIAFEL